MLTLVVSETCLTIRLLDRRDKTGLPTASWVLVGVKNDSGMKEVKAFLRKHMIQMNKNEAVLKKEDKTFDKLLE